MQFPVAVTRVSVTQIVSKNTEIHSVKYRRLSFVFINTEFTGMKNESGGLCLHEPLAGGVAQLVRASDHHSADAGSIPRCGKGLFSQSQLSVQTLLHVSVHPMYNHMH